MSDFRSAQPQNPNNWELLLPIVGAGILLTLRYFLMRYFWIPLGARFKFKSFDLKNPQVHQIVKLSKQLDLPYEQVEEWLLFRQAQNRNRFLQKLSDSSWRLIYYTSACLLGLFVLWDKPWLWDVNHCWIDFSNQSLTYDVWVYFMVCWSFAWCQLLGLCYDVRGKDFYIMILHHLVFTGAQFFCWLGNLYRISTLAIFFSDLTEIPLEVAKLSKSLSYIKFTKFMFCLFGFLWFLVRMGLQPFWLMKSVFVDAPKVAPDITDFLGYYLLRIVTPVFFLMNFVWSYFVVKSVVQVLVSGKLVDSRSDTEE